ncbi:MAG: lysostaphin resistance A-like protein [bacterium]
MSNLADQEQPRHPALKEIFLLILVSFILSVALTFFFSKTKSLQFILGELCLIMPTLVYLGVRKYDFVQVLRFGTVRTGTIAAACVLGLSVPVISDEIDRIVGLVVKTPPEVQALILETMRARSALDWIGLILGAVIFAGLVEEMLFRGLLQRALERRYAWPFAIFMSAVVFAVVHPIFWTVQVFLIGALLGFMAWRSQSIIPGIVFHCLNNLFSLLYLNFNLDQVGWYHWYGHVNPTVVAVAACIAFYALKWFNQQTEPTEEEISRYL